MAERKNRRRMEIERDGTRVRFVVHCADEYDAMALYDEAAARRRSGQPRSDHRGAERLRQRRAGRVMIALPERAALAVQRKNPPPPLEKGSGGSSSGDNE